MENKTRLGDLTPEEFEAWEKAREELIRRSVKRQMNWENDDIELQKPEPFGRITSGATLGQIKWPPPEYKEITKTEANYVLVFLDYATSKWSSKKFYSEEEADPFFNYYESAILVSVKYDEVIDIKGVKRE